MSKIMEDAINEYTKMYAVQVALRCLKSGKISFEEIAEYCDLTIEEVKELAEEYNLLPT